MRGRVSILLYIGFIILAYTLGFSLHLALIYENVKSIVANPIVSKIEFHYYYSSVNEIVELYPPVKIGESRVYLLPPSLVELRICFVGSSIAKAEVLYAKLVLDSNLKTVDLACDYDKVQELFPTEGYTGYLVIYVILHPHYYSKLDFDAIYSEFLNAFTNKGYNKYSTLTLHLKIETSLFGLSGSSVRTINVKIPHNMLFNLDDVNDSYERFKSYVRDISSSISIVYSKLEGLVHTLVLSIRNPYNNTLKFKLSTTCYVEAYYYGELVERRLVRSKSSDIVLDAYEERDISVALNLKDTSLLLESLKRRGYVTNFRIIYILKTEYIRLGVYGIYEFKVEEVKEA